MNFAIQFSFIYGLVLGLEYFNEDPELPFAVTIHLFFLRIMIFFNATMVEEDHNDLGDVG